MSSPPFNCEKGPGCDLCTKRSPIFNQLHITELNELNTNRYEISFSKGELLCKQGSPMSHLLSLTQGYVALIIENENKKQQIIKICKPYALVGSLGLFEDKRHHYTAVALNEVKVCFLENEKFLNVFYKSQVLSASYMKQISEETKLLYSRLNNLSHKTLQQKIVIALEQLLEISDPIDYKIFDPKIISLMTNVARDNVVRVLKDWERAGLISYSKSGMQIHGGLKALIS
ncbi:MAG: Crp/Fnr family transcriptional regulator [Bacteroidetes bacterium]|jgi:CRP-like cAMP-binding protein|nr:Crp/Fnr family transcriptional regulator [Bacteroidota bacterium]MBT3749681.1 Crp/Fnr family transcriptional regulator [Bacteroidota bacterium]MBT4400519.1 Crp/Fnr family transcriptional regulator [Bacteroidota bacterium]MBT4412256.1 Crp/Fnr family transcriptional regulator [Bacteroidota bacterium]MBT5428114.1 Crp/Fnr family transcriptional regulator [Bacteroidota bacterium]